MNEEQKKRFADALARLSNDADLLCGMASLVMEDAHEVLSRVRDAVGQQHCDEAARAAHQLKGMLCTFETGSPVNDLQEVIDAGRFGDSETMVRRFAAVEPDIVDLLKEIDCLHSPTSR